MQLKITEEIKNLDIKSIEKNLFSYKYDARSVRPLLKANIQDDSIENNATYNSFKGEVYENIIYELLLKYAQKCEYIKSFILKGPHQNRVDRFYKTGLMIDRSLQIVYKSNYKDISEFDALFFTEDSIYFVEMSTSKKTVSLNKRLDKKYALLKILFPKLHIRALIVLTQGVTGLSRFPKYCTIWITKDLTDIKLLKELVFNRRKRKLSYTYNDKKFIEAYKIKCTRFIYFQNLEWILKKVRTSNETIIDFNFLKSKQLALYFDIYTKFYIGFLKVEDFLSFVPTYSEKIENIFVSIEKINTTDFDIIFYVKNINKKLKRVRLSKELSIKEKEKDGFTNAEVRFIKYLIEDKYYLTQEETKQLLKQVKKFSLKS